ncbi:MAG TPA: peroxide stress protein YaaA [Phaeodactylibacter sp.]|nr:peroxide stress protein YaaA [Phaeodactylibacter sp.]
MLLLISPAKTLDFGESDFNHYSQPRMLDRSQELVDILRGKSEEELMELMSISEDLAELNHDRYQAFHTPFTADNAKPSLLAFKGDVYAGMGADDFTAQEMELAQQQLRILSGLYGLLRPLDLMQAYRLEMGTRLQNEHGKNLYEFWGEEVTKLINEDLREDESKAVVNLASKEYFSAVKPAALEGKLYNVDFKERRKGKYKVIAFYAKKARGMMCRYAIKNGFTEPEQLKGFDMDGYVYNEELSSEREYVFTRVGD